MAKLNLSSKPDSSSKSDSNGHSKTSASLKNGIARKAAQDILRTEKFIGKAETANSISESDQLTLRAWKKTFENKNKAA